MSHPFANIRFGSSGIRGPFGQLATPELAMALGAGAATLSDRILVGHDARTTGPSLVAAFTAGALSRGADVASIGLVPTPTLAHGTRRYGLGLEVTASHNPAPDNGFKFWTPAGAAIDAAARETLVKALTDPPGCTAWDKVGERGEDPTVAPAHAIALLEAVGELANDPRVVLDCGNGAASRFSPQLLRRAGAQVMTLNAQPDGTFPGRASEPSPANITALCKAVRASGALCGLAHDGDADRGVAVDERGRPVSGDAALVLLARELGARKVALPIDTSRQVTDALEGVEIEITPVGDAYVSEALAASGADFGGEPSGALIFPHVSLCPDGPHAVLLFARIAAEHGGLAELVDALPTYETRRTSIPFDGADKAAVMTGVRTAMAQLGEANTLDGVRVDLEEGWVLVRPSGTEPKVRVTSEARDKVRSDALHERAVDLVKTALKEVRA